jgi:hypothetical protein
MKTILKVALSKSARNSILFEEGVIAFKKIINRWTRIRRIHREMGKSEAHLNCVYHSCLEKILSVTEPLALISQIQYSGGSLLVQLFDSHPELHAHPHHWEVKGAKTSLWPKIDLNGNFEKWFDILFEEAIIGHFRDGFRKMGDNSETLLFVILPALQREIFLKYLGSLEAIAQRDVFDAYMTSYFGAWLNNQNRGGKKKFVAVFNNQLSMIGENIESFFEVYPDGRLISVIRDPKNWFQHAYQNDPEKYVDVSRSMNLWIKNYQGLLHNKEKFGDRICIIRFEDLIQKTEPVMHNLSEFLDIQFDRALLTPTFNKIPIKSDTGIQLDDHAIASNTIMKQSSLQKEKLEFIEKMTAEVYEKVLKFVPSII